MRTLSFIFLLSLLAASCQNAPKGDSDEANNDDAPDMLYTLTPFSPSTEFADAAITSVTYTDGRFDFGIGGETYELGVQTPDADAKMCANSAEGQHIHLIVNDEPYAAKYEAAFDYDIPNGEHYVLAFLSRSYHESIKTADAHVAKQVDVTDGSFTAERDAEAPLLFYSRPKGVYTGKAETEKVMLDFYLVNVPDFGSEHFVQADINGEVHIIDAWQPYYIEGLPMGENTITLTLVDKDGNKVNTPLNPVSRTFTLQADPAEEAGQ